RTRAGGSGSRPPSCRCTCCSPSSARARPPGWAWPGSGIASRAEHRHRGATLPGMSTTPGTPAGLDLDVLDPVAEAIESGAGLFEVVRAAARALDASVALLDASGTTLALTPPPGSA